VQGVVSNDLLFGDGQSSMLPASGSPVATTPGLILPGGASFPAGVELCYGEGLAAVHQELAKCIFPYCAGVLLIF